MTDDLTKTPDPDEQAELEPDVVELPSGKTLRAYAFYEPVLRCTDCHTQLKVRVFDGMAPRGHDDNIRYQEILSIGVGHCPRCQIQVVETIKGIQ